MIPRAFPLASLRRVSGLLLYCWLLTGVLPAAAPDALSGFVFRTTQTGGALNLGSSIEDTFVLGADGRWTHLRATHRSGASFTPYRTSIIDATMGNGSYTYLKTGENTAALTLVDQLAPGLFSPQYRYNLSFAATVASAPPLPTTAVYSGGFSRTREGSTLSGRFTLSPFAGLDSTPVANVAVRGHVSADRPLVVGFVVPAGRVQDLLIRAVGPSLAQLGVTGTWAAPDFSLYRDSTLIQGPEYHYGDWSATPESATNPANGLRRVFSYVGAFPMIAGSKDAADVRRLSPGAYTVVCNPAANDAGGEVLIEVYFLP